jgi:hypothetical protein
MMMMMMRMMMMMMIIIIIIIIQPDVKHKARLLNVDLAAFTGLVLITSSSS